MIGFIGGGNMAEALIRGMRAAGAYDISVSDPKDERRSFLEKVYGVRVFSSNVDVVKGCEVIVLAVKPQNIDGVLDEISNSISSEKTVVSIAAGIPIDYLRSKLRTDQIVRVMPNTPALVQEGMSVMSVCDCFSGPHINIVRSIFMSVGEVLSMREDLMNAVTAISGSGPAFVALFAEHLMSGAKKMGIREEDAAALTVQTLYGTAKMLHSGMKAEKLREIVTSPGGTTEAGLKVFGELNFDHTVEEALFAARTRAEELGRKS